MICRGVFSGLNSVANVDHIDNDDTNNPRNGTNWRMLCHSCNIKKSWILKKESIVESDTKVPFELKIGTKMELKWIKWLMDSIRKDGKVLYSKAINTGALEADCSPETIKRYLRKHLEDPDNPKAIFQTWMDSFYETYIKLSDSAQALWTGNDGV